MRKSLLSIIVKRILLIDLLLICFCVGKAQTTDELRTLAKRAYTSVDYKKAYSLYSSLDSIMPDMYFYDLWYYYVSAEMVNYYYPEIVVDSAKIESLLYRLAQSDGVERSWFYTSFCDDIKLHERAYWPQIDSLINVIHNNRCRPFIDSLAAMAERDQSVRNLEWTEETMKLAEVVDSTNTAKLKQLIEQYGFPTWELVGQYGQMNAWAIAQHSTEYLPHFLKQYRKAVEENNAAKRELAYLEDRLLVENGRPQIYGTQFLYSVTDSTAYLYATVDMEHLDDRRIVADMYSMEEYLKRVQLGNVDLHHGYGNYMTSYYPNLNNFYTLMNYWENKIDCSDTVLFYKEKEIYWFPKDLENIANYYYKYDTIFAVKTAKNMVLFGHTLDDEWNLSQPLMDTVKECYAELRADYERLINKEVDSVIKSMTTFDTLVKFLDSGSYHRYEVDSWNGHVKKLIQEKSETLTKQDYQEFFSWLFKQVEFGNYHLFEYAELYDEVHHRLFRTSYYGQKKFEKKVRIYKPRQLESRRKEVKLPFKLKIES